MKSRSFTIYLPTTINNVAVRLAFRAVGTLKCDFKVVKLGMLIQALKGYETVVQ